MQIEQLYKMYSEQIFQFINFIVGDEQLAKDLTQDTFIKAMHGSQNFQGQASEKTWLMKISRNVVYDHFRRKKILKFIPFLKEHEQIDYTYSPEHWLERQNEHYLLYEAIGQLPYAYREAIVLRKIEGVSIKDSAQILGWSESKVKNATERGMKKLKERLGGEEDA